MTDKPRLILIKSPPPPDTSDDTRTPEQLACTHGVSFDEAAAKGLGTTEIRARWPRVFGACPLGCGMSGIFYASYAHYIYGDW